MASKTQIEQGLYDHILATAQANFGFLFPNGFFVSNSRLMIRFNVSFLFFSLLFFFFDRSILFLSFCFSIRFTSSRNKISRNQVQDNELWVFKSLRFWKLWFRIFKKPFLYDSRTPRFSRKFKKFKIIGSEIQKFQVLPSNKRN